MNEPFNQLIVVGSEGVIAKHLLGGVESAEASAVLVRKIVDEVKIFYPGGGNSFSMEKSGL